MCEYLRISRNSYYTWRINKNKDVFPSKRNKLIKEIKRIFNESRQTYGSPRITAELNANGYKVSRSYIARIMNKEGIKFKQKKRFVNTTQSNHKHSVADNILDRKFNLSEIGKVWVSDITYIKIKEKWAYLTTMIDLADRQVVGWSLSKDMTYENTVLKAWSNARKKRFLAKGFILHSDRGVQYACNKIREIFSHSNEMEQSMSRKGNCWDNAVAESFFKTIKTELIYRNQYQSFVHVYNSVYDYIENWYNIKRRHSSLGYKSPLEMELELRGYHKIAA